MIKELSKITRQEWVAFRWIEIPPVMGDDDERMFRTAGRRTPDEAYSAMEEWEVTEEDRDIQEEKGVIN